MPEPEEKKPKPSPQKTEEPSITKAPPRRILTAEGWKRMMLGKKAKK